MNIQHLLKQAQQMQNQIGKVEKEIERQNTRPQLAAMR